MRTRDDWGKVDGIEVRLVTGEEAKVQLAEGQGRAWLITRATASRRATIPVILRYSRRKVDVLNHAIAWVAHR